MDSIANFSQALSSGDYMPHGYCLVWSEPLLFTYVVADGLIGVSYYSIPFALMYFVYKRRDLVFNWIFVMFSIFIFACGTTHFMDLWTIWNPNYWLDASIRYLTGLVSFATAIMLWLLIPKALKLPSPAQLEAANQALQQEIRERQRAEEEIRTLYQALQERSLELEAANKELEAFGYSVSHDLRAPLNGISGFSDALREDYYASLDSTGRHYLDRVQANIQRMSSLIEGLLMLSRLSRSKLKHEVVNLSQMAEAIVGEFKEREPERQIKVTIEDDLVVYGDERLLRVALTNLLHNAWKFTSKKEQPFIAFGAREGGVLFVHDNGAGFDMVHVDKLFNTFQRLHGLDEFAGNGIGLATVQRVINRHGGHIWAEATESEGASFYFTLDGFISLGT